MAIAFQFFKHVRLFELMLKAFLTLIDPVLLFNLLPFHSIMLKCTAKDTLPSFFSITDLHMLRNTCDSPFSKADTLRFILSAPQNVSANSAPDFSNRLSALDPYKCGFTPLPVKADTSEVAGA